jgi:hypothetical protein
LAASPQNIRVNATAPERSIPRYHRIKAPISTKTGQSLTWLFINSEQCKAGLFVGNSMGGITGWWLTEAQELQGFDRIHRLETDGPHPS